MESRKFEKVIVEADLMQEQKKRPEVPIAVLRELADGVWVHDFRENRVYYDEKWLSTLGYSEDDLGRISWKNLVAGRNSNVFGKLKKVEELAEKEGKTQRFEAVYSLKPNKEPGEGVRYVRVKSIGFIETDSGGNIIRAVGIHINMTESLKSIETLTICSGCNMLTNEDLTIQEYIKKHIPELILITSSCGEEGESYKNNPEIRYKESQRKRVQNNYGNAELLKDDYFKESELLEIYENLTSGVWYRNLGKNGEKEGNVYYSSSWHESRGFSRMETEEVKWLNHIHQDDRERVSQSFQEYMNLAKEKAKKKNKEDFRFEETFRMISKKNDQGYVWIKSIGKLYWDGKGQQYKIVGIHIDVSDVPTLKGEYEFCDHCNRLNVDGEWRSIFELVNSVCGHNISHGMCKDCSADLMEQMKKRVAEGGFE